jgi:hypothetical protein
VTPPPATEAGPETMRRAAVVTPILAPGVIGLRATW